MMTLMEMIPNDIATTSGVMVSFRLAMASCDAMRCRRPFIWHVRIHPRERLENLDERHRRMSGEFPSTRIAIISAAVLRSAIAILVIV